MWKNVSILHAQLHLKIQVSTITPNMPLPSHVKPTDVQEAKILVDITL